MTFSILARDPDTGCLGGAATTGSLCVGGWVLRGDARAGLSASQGAAPSTFWGEDVLAAMREGTGAAEAVTRITGADEGREARQLAALDLLGGGGVFTGADNTDIKGGRVAPDLVVSGNLLACEAVLDACAEGFLTATGKMSARLIAALLAGEAAGGDSRGLQSASILVVGADIPPLTLRVDWHEQPISALSELLERAQAPAYGDWLTTVPVLSEPQRRAARG